MAVLESVRSLGELFRARVERSPDAVSLRYRQGEEFVGRTWLQLADQVATVAQWLLEVGVKPGDTVASFAPNSWKWVVADQAIYQLGAVHVPIHAPLTGPQASFQITDSESRALLLHGAEEQAKLAGCPASSNLPTLVFFPDQAGQHGGVHWDELSPVRWQPFLAEFPFAAADEQPVGDATATILYTSGTTGEPKGVMLSHDNLLSNAAAALEGIGQQPDDTRLGFLPLSHIFARTCDLYTWILAGSQLALASSRDTVLADCHVIKPQILNGVPYFFDRVRRYLQDQWAAKGESHEKLSLRDLFGGKIRFCCSGGAALPDHLYDFYLEHDVPILQGYGLTESSPVISLSSETACRRGAVGKAVRDVQIRIAEDGEVLTRGPHVMQGYYRKPDATVEVIRDGWLHTGDLGRLDDDGFLYITGRKKELIVTAGGKNVAPVYLESLLTEHPLIAQAVVLGDDEKFLTALIVVSNAEAGGAEKQQSTADELRGAIRAAIDEQLAVVSRYEQIGEFTIVDRPFTVENGMLTPKLSLRRPMICAHYAECIDRMYGRGCPG